MSAPLRLTLSRTIQNVTVGGKKSKKEEQKPYMCAIYRRDIASLLPEIQQWRLTSSHSNASHIECPSELPPFKYHRLTVTFVSSHLTTELASSKDVLPPHLFASLSGER
jgi:hypothetical protein